MKPVILSLMLVSLLLPGCGGEKSPQARHAAEHDFSEANVCTTCADSACDTCPVPGAPIDTASNETPPSLPSVSETEEATLPRLWEFGSEKCLPCITMKGILEPLAAECAGKVDVRIINVYEEKELTKQFRIVTIPTQVFMDSDGNELFRHVGVFSRDSIAAKFAELGFPVLAAGSAPPPAPAASGT